MNDIVAMAIDSPDAIVEKGRRGVVGCLYHTIPPSYEVTFWDSETGKEGYGSVMDEDDLVAADGPENANERFTLNLILRGTHSEAARQYNLDRARFLRGEIDQIAPNLPAYIREKDL